MCDYLNTFDFSANDATTTSAVINDVTNFLKRAEAHFAQTTSDSPPPSPSTSEATSPTTKDISPISLKIKYNERFLDDPLLKALRKDLPKYDYISTGGKCPQVSLFGDHPYVYNKATQNLKPTAITDISTIGQVLDIVNCKLGKNYNSVLVSKYHNKNTFLDWHKDNEPEVDPSIPISTLSIGATRRFMISDHREQAKRTQFIEKELGDNSILVMAPSLQFTHYHKVACGRYSFPDERGARYSLTFRRLRMRPNPGPTLSISPPPVTVSVQNESIAANVHINKVPEHTNCYNCLVFGSSLTGGLKEDVLTKREHDKTFKVYCQPGARVATVNNKIKDVFENNMVCRECVDNVFIVCGGNDTENIRSRKGMETLKKSFTLLIEDLSNFLPDARINVLSLIPRRLVDDGHLYRIHETNEFLTSLCPMYKNCFLISIFTNYLSYKERFFNYGEYYLNKKLFKSDRLHFSPLGQSVLAKVLIGVANRPYF